MTGTDILHVPYRGGSAAVQSQMVGQTDLSFPTLPSVMQHIKAGRLKGLAVTGEQRSLSLPDVPTVREAGLPQMTAVTWTAIFAPAKIPQPLLARSSREISAVLNLPEVRAQFRDFRWIRPPTPRSRRRLSSRTKSTAGVAWSRPGISSRSEQSEWRAPPVQAATTRRSERAAQPRLCRQFPAGPARSSPSENCGGRPIPAL